MDFSPVMCAAEKHVREWRAGTDKERYLPTVVTPENVGIPKVS